MVQNPHISRGIAPISVGRKGLRNPIFVSAAMKFVVTPHANVSLKIRFWNNTTRSHAHTHISHSLHKSITNLFRGFLTQCTHSKHRQSRCMCSQPHTHTHHLHLPLFFYNFNFCILLSTVQPSSFTPL